MPNNLKLTDLPAKPGVYLFKDQANSVIYVGKAKSLRKRVSSYFNKTPDLKTSIMLNRLANIDFIITKTELDALLLENDLIKKYLPRYNIALRDDKSYPYLKLTLGDKWPRLIIARKNLKDGARYFGRYEGKMVREILRLAKKLLPIRWCKEEPLKMRRQPCLYYRLGICAGPCVKKICHKDYMSLVGAVISLLEGDMLKSRKKLRDEMEKASRVQDYELAAAFRDRLGVLDKMVEGRMLKRAPGSRTLTDLEELKDMLKLSSLPMRIETFDVSNTQGTNVVASMVTFYGGAPLRHDYRKFRIKSTGDKPNDVAAITEAVGRRYFGRLAGKLPAPDLVVVDGGLPQVNAAARIVKEKFPLIGLAKRDEEIFFPGRSRPLVLPKSVGALKLLQRMRDEAHRFAVSYHRQRRAGNLFAP